MGQETIKSRTYETLILPTEEEAVKSFDASQSKGDQIIITAIQLVLWLLMHHSLFLRRREVLWQKQLRAAK